MQVRVYDPAHGRDIAFGWAYMHPQREAKAGAPITVWNRLKRVCSPVSIDWGDGGPRCAIDDCARHTYRSPGLYAMTLEARGPRNETVIVKLPAQIE